MDTGNSLDGSVGRNLAYVHPTNRTESVLSNISEENKTDIDEHVSKNPTSNKTAAAQMTRASEPHLQAVKSCREAMRSGNRESSSSEVRVEVNVESSTQDMADPKPYHEGDLGGDDDADDDAPSPSLLCLPIPAVRMTMMKRKMRTTMETTRTTAPTVTEMTSRAHL